MVMIGFIVIITWFAWVAGCIKFTLWLCENWVSENGTLAGIPVVLFLSFLPIAIAAQVLSS